MAIARDELLGLLSSWGIDCETISHAASPTCAEHSENIKGTAFEKYIGNGQAKNLFFKVPSGGGKLKGRLFLVCALVETVVDAKKLSARLGIKPSAPLRFAADEVFDQVLQCPQGSVNPFVMAQSSCDEVTLLLDEGFRACERLLFHPMQNDYSTALTAEQLAAFLERAAPGRYAFVDLASDAPLDIAKMLSAGAPAAAAPPKPQKAQAPAAAPQKAAAAAAAAAEEAPSNRTPAWSLPALDGKESIHLPGPLPCSILAEGLGLPGGLSACGKLMNAPTPHGQHWRMMAYVLKVPLIV